PRWGRSDVPTGRRVPIDGGRRRPPPQPPRPRPAAPPASAASLAPSVSPERRSATPASASGAPHERMPEPMPSQVDPVARHEEFLPRRTTDKAMQLEAESAEQAPASQLRANEQLPRGTLGQLADQRAREPYGRDRPDARNRAGESTARIQ